MRVTDAQRKTVREGVVRYARLILGNASKAPIELSGIRNADGMVVGAPVLRFDRKLSNGKWENSFKESAPPAQALSAFAVARGSQAELSAMLDQAIGGLQSKCLSTT